MRRLIYPCLILLSTALVAQAQPKLPAKNVAKAMNNAGRGGAAGIARTKVPVRTGPLNGISSGQILRNAPTNVPTTPLTMQPQTLVPSKKVEADLPSQVSVAPTPQVRLPDVPTLQTMDLEEQVFAELQKQQALREQLWAQSYQSGIGKSVLFAPLMSSQEIGYSVTVFKTKYNNTEEIFGVLPSHALPSDFSHRFDSVGKHFKVAVKQPDGSLKMLQAQVVQISPQSMLDLSLVKFETQDEPLLAPLQLADSEAQLNEPLFSYGFAAGKETAISRSVNALSFLSVRTNQAIEGAREGFCGSPLLDANGQIKAIHTGTVEGSNGKEDVSYGTHVTFIRKLVEAYHNQGQASYALQLNDHHVADLQVDEYISAFYLYDANGKKLAQQNIDGKFSQSTILKALKSHPQASYLQLTSRKAQWEYDTDTEILKENRLKTDKTKRQHWYNLQTKQIEPARPGIIKM